MRFDAVVEVGEVGQIEMWRVGCTISQQPEESGLLGVLSGYFWDYLCHHSSRLS